MQHESNSEGSHAVLSLTCSLCGCSERSVLVGAVGRAAGDVKGIFIRNKRGFLGDYGERICGICKVEGSGLRNRDVFWLWSIGKLFSFFWEACRPSGGFAAGVASKVKHILFLTVISEKKTCSLPPVSVPAIS